MHPDVPIHQLKDEDMFNLSSQDRSDLVAFLQDLIRIPSPSTEEKAVAERLAEEMRQVGFPRVRHDRIGNVVGCLGASTGSRLIYDGHMDTVSVSDLFEAIGIRRIVRMVDHLQEDHILTLGAIPG